MPRLSGRKVVSEGSADESRRSFFHRGLLLLVLIVTVVAFAPGLHAPFQFDDIGAIERNASLESFGAAWSPPRQIAVSGRPIVNESFALNRALSERLAADSANRKSSEVFGVRVVNLAIHLACGLLLYGLVVITSRFQPYSERISTHARALALFVAGLWMVHPLQTETVHYATQRTESLMVLFFFGTMYASARAWTAAAARRRYAWYALGVASALLGMGSKEVMIIAPIMVILYDRAFRYGAWREMIAGAARRLPYYAALAATSIWGIALAAGRPRSASVGLGLGISPWQYLQSQGWAIWRYLRLVVWPIGLSIDYGPNPIGGPAALLGVAGLIVGFIATIVAWRRADRFGWLAFLGSWFYLILAPSSSVIPIATEIAAERRMYLPLAAVLTLAGVWLVVAISRSRVRVPAIVAAVLVFAGFASLTTRRSSVFADLEALWREAVRNTPRNPRAPENLATVITQKDSTRTAEAEALLHEAIRRDSSFGSAWWKLGTLALNADRVDSARFYLDRALVINPRHPGALEEMADVYLRGADTTRAIDLLRRSAEGAPNDTVLIRLAQLHAATGRTNEALAEYLRALDVNPARADVARFVSASLVESNRGTEAIPILERLARSPRGEAIDLALLSVAYATTGDANRAASAATEAVKRGSNDPSVYLLSGRALLEVSDATTAEPILTRAVALSAAPAEALTVLAAAKLMLGKRADAVELLRRALIADPAYAPARAALSRLR